MVEDVGVMSILKILPEVVLVHRWGLAVVVVSIAAAVHVVVAYHIWFREDLFHTASLIRE